MDNKRELIKKLEQLDDEASLSDIQGVTSKFYNEGIWISPIGRRAFGISLSLAVITLLIMTVGRCKIFDIVAYCLWTILPPSWFLFEYAWLFPDSARFDANQLDDLKYKNELAGKIWTALVVLITVIIYLKYGRDIFEKHLF